MDYIDSKGQLLFDAFVGKLSTSQDYSWLWEGQFDIHLLSEHDIREYVKMHAGVIYDMYSAECDEGAFTPLSFYQFLVESDYEDAVDAFLNFAERERTF